jgi:hypothetical protein
MAAVTTSPEPGADGATCPGCATCEGTVTVLERFGSGTAFGAG